MLKPTKRWENQYEGKKSSRVSANTDHHYTTNQLKEGAKDQHLPCACNAPDPKIFLPSMKKLICIFKFSSFFFGLGKKERLGGERVAYWYTHPRAIYPRGWGLCVCLCVCSDRFPEWMSTSDRGNNVSLLHVGRNKPLFGVTRVNGWFRAVLVACTWKMEGHFQWTQLLWSRPFLNLKYLKEK